MSIVSNPLNVLSLLIVLVAAGATAAMAEDDIDIKMQAAERCLASSEITPEELELDLWDIAPAKRQLFVDCLTIAGVGPMDFARAMGEPMHPI